MSYVSHLQCVSCGRTFVPDEIDYTCPDCGPLLGTREVIYRYEELASVMTREYLSQNTNFTHWRYLPLLPVEDAEKISPLSVGWTPLYRSKRLERKWDMKGIWIKDDSRNPSASLKDRASSVAVVKALEKGIATVTAASTGNAASSWATFTALTDLRTVIFVPETAPRAKVAQLLLHGATVLKVKGTYDDAFDLCCQAAEQWGWYNRSTAINPVLGEGKKTTALEICEQLRWKVPDYVLVSVGDGCIFQGMWKGFKEFHRLGLIQRLPRMIGVQAEGSAPLVHAWENDLPQCEAIYPQTIADSIAVGVPRDQIKALRAVRESNGRFVAVSDEEILNAIATLAQQVGIMAEPAGAAALAGLYKLRTEGLIGSQETAVVMVTGHGLKDIDTILKAVASRPMVVENSLSHVADQLRKSGIL